MFSEFAPITGSLFKQRVNTGLGIVFLGSCAFWAALFIWNVSTGDNPIDAAIASAIEHRILGEGY